jgi:2'-5' RNA ligase
MKRVFVAVDISEEARRQTTAYIESLKSDFSGLRVGWEKPEKLHLTMKFLGDTNENQLKELEDICCKIAAEIPKFDLQIAETGVFPSPRNARVMWVDVKDEKGNLAKINRALEIQCERIGFAAEKRNFKPHLTIARLKEPRNSHELVKKHLEKDFEPIGMKVAEIVIYESRLHPTGSIYEKLTTLQLNNQTN